MKEASSSSTSGARSLVRSAAAMGGSSVLTTLANIVKTKVVAVVLGPQGVGAIGILGSITGVIATLAGMGLSNAAVRPIAQAIKGGDRRRLASLDTGLSLFAIALGAIGAAVLWGFRGPLGDLADLALDETRYGWAAAGIGIGVFASAWLEAKKAWIVGSERPLDWARVTLAGGLLAAAMSVAAVLVLPETVAIVVLVMSLPVCSLLVASWFARGLVPRSPRPALGVMWRELAPIVRLGAALMVTSLLVVATLFAAQWIIKAQDGIVAVGHFQASWTISATAMGFFLGALWIDYSPRLSAVAGDARALTAIMNEQLYLSLLLAAPALLWVAALAPWIVRWLYTPDFLPAVAVLRWQALGDLARVAEAALGFVLVIQSRSRMFVLKEIVGNFAFLAVLWGGLGRFGLPVAGVAFFVAQLLRVGLVSWSLGRELGFTWSPANRRLLGLVGACALVLVGSVYWNAVAWRWPLSIFALVSLSAVCAVKLRRALRPEMNLVTAG